MTTVNLDTRRRVAWCLRRRSCDVRCVIYASTLPVEVHIVQDRDVILKETFATEQGAAAWAKEYGERLQEHGWQRRPEDCSPSSAA